jgi:hypothetical protein
MTWQSRRLAPALNSFFLILGIDFLCLESINQTLQNVRAEFSIAIPAQCRWQNVDLLLTHLLLKRWINDVKRTYALWLPVLLFGGRNSKGLQGRLTDLPGALTVSGSAAGSGRGLEGNHQ